MDFKDLSYIIAISKYQSITKAADSLYLSQPTLTKFLQNLEKSVGQKLFKKLGNKFILTYAGERYVEKSVQILKLKKELDQELADIIQSNIGILKIAFPVMRGTYMLPCALPIFKSLYPQVYVDVREENSDILENLILSGETDIAFFNLPIRSSDISHEIISHEEILLAMHPDHPLAGAGIYRKDCKYPWIDLNKLKNEKFIMQVKEQRTRQIVDKLMKDNKFQPDIVLTTRNITASLLLVAKRYGVCFICETHLKYINATPKPILFSIGTPCTTVDFVAAFRKNSYVSYHAQEFIKIVRDFT